MAQAGRALHDRRPLWQAGDRESGWPDAKRRLAMQTADRARGMVHGVNWTAAMKRMPVFTPGEPTSPWLVDEFVEAYVRWREECAAVRGMYELWTGAETGDWALAFAAYGAAVDREERAAREYRDCADRIRRQPPSSFEEGALDARAGG